MRFRTYIYESGFLNVIHELGKTKETRLTLSFLVERLIGIRAGV